MFFDVAYRWCIDTVVKRYPYFAVVRFRNQPRYVSEHENETIKWELSTLIFWSFVSLIP